MKLIIDTNVLLAEPNLAGVAWTRLLLIAKARPATVIVPEVVIREYARRRYLHAKAKRTEGISKWGEAVAALRAARIRLPQNLPSVRNLRDQPQETDREISERLRRNLTEKGVVIREIPTTIGHAALIDWSLQEHPPFDSTDRGYRDALIWVTVREVAVESATNCSIVFVTNDNDCCDGRTTNLHPQLVADLASVTENQVMIAKSIDDAINGSGMERYVVHPESSDSIESTAGPNAGGNDPDVVTAVAKYNGVEYAEPSIVDMIAGRLEGECERLLGEDPTCNTLDGEWQPSNLDPRVTGDIEDPTIVDVRPDMRTASAQVHEVFEGGTLVGEAAVTAAIKYEGFVQKSEYFESESYWDDVDEHYNDEYVAVVGEFSAELTFRFILENGGVEAFEFGSLLVL